MGIGGDIAKRRSALGLSQKQLADKVGGSCRQSTVARIESGQSEFSRYVQPILSALSAEEAKRGLKAAPPREGLDPREVLAAFEVLLRLVCDSDIAAREAAAALLAVIQAPKSPPLGLDAPTLVRFETQQIVGLFSTKAH